MKTPFRLASVVYLLFSIFHLLAATAASAQGSLTPPGAPAPIFKTLQQIEPRTDLQSPTLPPGVTTDANFEFIINQPGSYYLSANLAVTKFAGIKINAEGVTLDLNGFEVRRTGGSGGVGIQILVTSHRCVVRNGSIKGFFTGADGYNGGSPARGGRFEQLTVTGCATFGLSAGEGWEIDRCNAHDNAGQGIVAFGKGSTVRDCSAINNRTPGIAVVEGVVSNCAANTNTTPADTTQTGGIVAFDSTVINCVSSNNTSGSTATDAGAGIYAQGSSIVKNCTVESNKGDGIIATGNCLILENNSVGNGNGIGNGAGIRAFNSGNRIEGNSTIDNDIGIRADGTGNLIIKNTSRGGGAAITFAPGNSVGEIIDVWNGGAGATITATNPWANFAY